VITFTRRWINFPLNPLVKPHEEISETSRFA
jgi:hypothetical protein